MARFLGVFKENTGSFLLESEGGNDNKFSIYCDKKTIPVGADVDYVKVANYLREFGYPFEVDIDVFFRAKSRLFESYGSIRSFHQLYELIRRSLNVRDEVQYEKLASTLESLTQHRQFTRILTSVIQTAEDFEVDSGVSHKYGM